LFCNHTACLTIPANSCLRPLRSLPRRLVTFLLTVDPAVARTATDGGGEKLVHFCKRQVGDYQLLRPPRNSFVCRVFRTSEDQPLGDCCCWCGGGGSKRSCVHARRRRHRRRGARSCYEVVRPPPPPPPRVENNLCTCRCFGWWASAFLLMLRMVQAFRSSKKGGAGERERERTSSSSAAGSAMVVLCHATGNFQDAIMNRNEPSRRGGQRRAIVS
jgi:hypothetical protein